LDGAWPAGIKLIGTAKILDTLSVHMNVKTSMLALLSKLTANKSLMEM
jgi:hypothetical protein